MSDNVANQETDEATEQCVLEAFGEDRGRGVSQEQFDVAPTSFVEPEMDSTLQVNLLLGAKLSAGQSAVYCFVD